MLDINNLKNYLDNNITNLKVFSNYLKSVILLSKDYYHNLSVNNKKFYNELLSKRKDDKYDKLNNYDANLRNYLITICNSFEMIYFNYNEFIKNLETEVLYSIEELIDNLSYNKNYNTSRYNVVLSSKTELINQLDQYKIPYINIASSLNHSKETNLEKLNQLKIDYKNNLNKTNSDLFLMSETYKQISNDVISTEEKHYYSIKNSSIAIKNNILKLSKNISKIYYNLEDIHLFTHISVESNINNFINKFKYVLKGVLNQQNNQEIDEEKDSKKNNLFSKIEFVDIDEIKKSIKNIQKLSNNKEIKDAKNNISNIKKEKSFIKNLINKIFDNCQIFIVDQNITLDNSLVFKNILNLFSFNSNNNLYFYNTNSFIEYFISKISYLSCLYIKSKENYNLLKTIIIQLFINVNNNVLNYYHTNDVFDFNINYGLLFIIYKIIYIDNNELKHIICDLNNDITLKKLFQSTYYWKKILNNKINLFYYQYLIIQKTKKIIRNTEHSEEESKNKSKSINFFSIFNSNSKNNKTLVSNTNNYDSINNINLENKNIIVVRVLKEYIPIMSSLGFCKKNIYRMLEELKIVVNYNSKLYENLIEISKYSFTNSFYLDYYKINNPNKTNYIKTLNNKRYLFDNSSINTLEFILALSAEYIENRECLNILLLNKHINMNIKKILCKKILDSTRFSNNFSIRYNVWKTILNIGNIMQKYDYNVISNNAKQINNSLINEYVYNGAKNTTIFNLLQKNNTTITHNTIKDIQIILLDVNRTSFKYNSDFKKVILENILKSIVITDDSICYNQGMSYIAAFIIEFVYSYNLSKNNKSNSNKNLDTNIIEFNIIEKESYYFLLSILLNTSYLNNFNNDLKILSLNLKLFEKAISIKCPSIANHLKKNNIDSKIYASSWFITLFSKYYNSIAIENNNIEFLFNIWDNFLINDYIEITNYSLAIIEYYSNDIIRLKYDDIIDFFVNNTFTPLMLNSSNNKKIYHIYLKVKLTLEEEKILKNIIENDILQ